MARSDLTPTGILIPDSRISTESLSATDSSYQQAGPSGPGAIVLPSGAALVLEGEQAASVVVTATRGGPPSRAGGARIKWRPSTGSNDYGWTPPTWHDYTTATADLSESDVCDAIWLQSGQLLVVVGRGSAGDTACARWTPSTDTWAAGGDLPFIATEATPTAGICVLRQGSDGTVYALVTDRVATSMRCMQVKSTDAGATWATVGQCAFSGGAPVYGRKGRWWLTDAGVHVLTLLDSDVIQTWSSTDGLQWSLVGSLSGIFAQGVFGFPSADVQLTASGHLLYVYAADTDTDATVCRVCHPTQDPATAAEITVYAPGGGVEISDCCILAAETGRVYVWVTGVTTDTMALWSDDNGQTWTGLAVVYQAGDNTQGHLRRAVACAGSMAVVRADWLNGTASLQAYVYQIGGWQTWETAPVLADNDTDDGSRLTWGLSTEAAGWQGRTHTQGFNLGTGWTTYNAGTPTVATGPLGRSLTTGSGDIERYEHEVATGRSAVFFCDMKCTGGGQINSLRVGWKIQTRLSGSVKCQLQCRILTTGFRLTDGGGVDLATVSRDMATNYTQFLVCMESGNRVEVYYKAAAAQEWTSLYQTSSPSVASLSDNFVCHWGNVGSGGSPDSVSLWRFVGVTRINEADSAIAYDRQWRCSQSTDTPRQLLLGRPLGAYAGSLGSPATLPAASAREVVAIGDTVTAAPRYTHPIASIDPRRSPSPRRKWRSTDTSEQAIAWELDATHNAQLRCTGLYISGANFRTAKLQYHNGVAWTDWADIDLRHSDAMNLQRVGTTVTTQTTPQPWLQQGEAIGGSVTFASGDVRRISANDAGQGDTSFRLTCTGIDDSETAAGTGYLQLPQGFVLGFPAVTVRRVRLLIAAQTTAEGYFECGLIAIGQIYAFGLPFEWGTVETSTPDVQTFELPGYQLTARRSPPARRWSVQWPMASLSALRTSATPAAYFSPDGSTGTRYGMQDDLYQLIRGLSEQGTDTVPVLILPALETSHLGGTTWTATETRRDVLWWGRIESTSSSTLVVGVEGSATDGELLRVGSLTLAETV